MRDSYTIPHSLEIEIKDHISRQMFNWLQLSNLPSYMSLGFMAAMDEAFKSNSNLVKTGCAIVYKSYVLSRGHNQLKTHPLQQKYNLKFREFTSEDDFEEKTQGHTLHAEIDAITSVSYPDMCKTNWKDAKVFVYRVGKGLKDYTGLALPCQACAGALQDLGVKEIYYTTGDPDKPFGRCDI